MRLSGRDIMKHDVCCYGGSVSAATAVLWQVLIPDVIDEVVFTPPVVRLRSPTPLVEAAWTLAVMWSNSTSNSHLSVTFCLLILPRFQRYFKESVLTLVLKRDRKEAFEAVFFSS